MDINMDIIFATNNMGKLKEVGDILGECGFNVLSLADCGIDVDVIEDGETFEQNATKKALEIMKLANKPVLADDSGIEIEFLGNEPGVHSARFLGKDTPYNVKNQQVLEMLKDAQGEQRRARFVCVLAFAQLDGTVTLTKGTLEGEIAQKASGVGGFGYDPIFFLKQFEQTTGQLPKDIKNAISHRRIALDKMKEKLKEI